MSAVAETIGSDISTIADSSREVSSGTVEIAQSASELSRMATTLKTTMEGFKV
jgi:methyl-accepting chemotaxis protein